MELYQRDHVRSAANARTRDGRHAEFVGEAVGMLGAKLEYQTVRLLIHGGDEKLDHIAGLVFEFYPQILASQPRRGVLECLQEFSSGDAVVAIIADPRLQEAGDQTAHGAAAIDEILLHAPDFGDVEMRFNRLTICPDDGQRERRRGSDRDAGASRLSGRAIAGGGSFRCVHKLRNFESYSPSAFTEAIASFSACSASRGSLRATNAATTAKANAPDRQPASPAAW